MTKPESHITSEQEIIAQAEENFGPLLQPVDLLSALENFWGNGASDEFSGDAEFIGFFYRVDRWIVWTDSQGFHDVETFDTEEAAHRHFEKLDRDYAATFDVDECF